MKSLKDAIEGQPDFVLNISGFIDEVEASIALLGSHKSVPHKLEGAFVVLLAHENLVGRVLEVAYKLVVTYKRSSRFLTPGRIRRGFIVNVLGAVFA